MGRPLRSGRWPQGALRGWCSEQARGGRSVPGWSGATGPAEGQRAAWVSPAARRAGGRGEAVRRAGAPGCAESGGARRDRPTGGAAVRIRRGALGQGRAGSAGLVMPGRRSAGLEKPALRSAGLEKPALRSAGLEKPVAPAPRSVELGASGQPVHRLVGPAPRGRPGRRAAGRWRSSAGLLSPAGGPGLGAGRGRAPLQPASPRLRSAAPPPPARSRPPARAGATPRAVRRLRSRRPAKTIRRPRSRCPPTAGRPPLQTREPAGTGGIRARRTSGPPSRNAPFPYRSFGAAGPAPPAGRRLAISGTCPA